MVAPGLVPTAPTVGRIGTSPSAPQPGPEMCVRLYPMIVLSLYSYPPPAGRLGVSGLHWTIPNGTSAPGKSSNPFDVPISGLTTEAGSETKATGAAVAAGVSIAATVTEPAAIAAALASSPVRVMGSAFLSWRHNTFAKTDELRVSTQTRHDGF